MALVRKKGNRFVRHTCMCPVATFRGACIAHCLPRLLKLDLDTVGAATGGVKPSLLINNCSCRPPLMSNSTEAQQIHHCGPVSSFPRRLARGAIQYRFKRCTKTQSFTSAIVFPSWCYLSTWICSAIGTLRTGTHWIRSTDGVL